MNRTREPFPFNAMFFIPLALVTAVRVFVAPASPSPLTNPWHYLGIEIESQSHSLSRYPG
jgi:hypothetical protein